MVTHFSILYTVLLHQIIQLVLSNKLRDKGLKCFVVNWRQRQNSFENISLARYNYWVNGPPQTLKWINVAETLLRKERLEILQIELFRIFSKAVPTNLVQRDAAP